MGFAEKMAIMRAYKAESGFIPYEVVAERARTELPRLQPYMDALEVVAQRFNQMPNYPLTFGAEAPGVRLTSAGESGPSMQADMTPTGFGTGVMPRPTLSMVSGVRGGANEDRHFAAFVRAADTPGEVDVGVVFIADDMRTFPHARDYQLDVTRTFKAASPEELAAGVRQVVAEYAAEMAPALRQPPTPVVPDAIARAFEAESRLAPLEVVARRARVEMPLLRPYAEALEQAAAGFLQTPDYPLVFGAEAPAVRLTPAGGAGPFPEAETTGNGFGSTVMSRPTLAMVSGVIGGENEDRHFGAFIRAADTPGRVAVEVAFIADDMASFPYARDYRAERSATFEAGSPAEAIAGIQRAVADYAAQHAPLIRAGLPATEPEPGISMSGYGR